MLSIRKIYPRVLIFLLLLTFLLISETEIIFGLNIQTTESNGKIYVKIETENNASCMLKKGVQVVNLESQNGFIHEKLINLSFFQDVNHILVICYKKDNMFDFESAQIKINSSEIKPNFFEENLEENNEKVSRFKGSLKHDIKMKNDEDETNYNRSILLSISFIIFCLIALISIFSLAIFKKYKKDINEAYNQHINKRKYKQKIPIFQDTSKGNETTGKTSSKNENIFDQGIDSIKQSESSVGDNQTPTNTEIVQHIEKNVISRGKIDYNIFSEFEQDSKEKENKNTQKNTDLQEALEKQEIFEQTLKILKNNKPQDVLFLLYEIIEHNFIEGLINHINTKNDLIAKNKMIDALYLLRKRNMIDENNLRSFINQLTR